MEKSKITSFIIATFFCCVAFCQEIRIDNIQNIAGIDSKNGSLVIAGDFYTDDSTITSITKFKADNTIDWKIVFREGSYNSIDNFLVTKDTIFVNLLTGASESRYDYFSARRYVLILNNKGKILNRVFIGNSWGGCSNFLLNNNKLYFTYKNASSPYRNKVVADTSIFTTLYLNNKNQLSKKFSISKYFTPASVFKTDSSIVTLGNYDKYQNGSIREQLALIWKNDSLHEKIITSAHYENYKAGFVKNHSIFVVSDCRFASDSNYIKLTSIPQHHSKYIYFSDHKWTWVGNNFIAAKDGFWVLVQKLNDDKYHLLKLSAEGKIIQEKSYSLPYPTNSMAYFIAGGNIYFVIVKNSRATLLIKKV